MGESRKTFKKIILDDLKKRGLHAIVSKIVSIKYRSFAGGDAVDVSTINLWKSERDALESILSNYEDGHFDGMIDMYVYRRDEITVERTAKYVHMKNEFSQDVKDKMKEILKEQWDITDDQSCKRKRDCWYDTAIWRDLCELEDRPK